MLTIKHKDQYYALREQLDPEFIGFGKHIDAKPAVGIQYLAL